MKMGMDCRIAVDKAFVACKHSLCLRQTELLLHANAARHGGSPAN
ncbi:hypothetical protein HMPREF1981_02454 [Bacteroides pyogenes F0041]|uniref:Uncharacterized protein n=1 Tax=Bacteroides pyogenes F0041 TaxID=1321819 RepID=U2CHY2_9BACE|nr:hypothetical protein HMPREF1981_02454 [Bacteroides pyogenes F0041]